MAPAVNTVNSPLTISCPNCGQRYRLRSHGQIKRVKCSKCGQSFPFKPDVATDADDASRSEKLELNENDLSSFQHPEKRFMSILHMNLRGMADLSDRLPPDELRTTMNSILHDAVSAIQQNEGTLERVTSHEIVALFGAPSYFKNHAFRAIKTACDQLFQLKALHKHFLKHGKAFPEFGIGIHTGEMMIGHIGSIDRQEYNALGNAVIIAEKLSGMARNMDILLSEDTLRESIEVLPEGWEVNELQTKNQNPVKLAGSRQDQVILNEKLRDKLVFFGPGIKKKRSNVHMQFRYLSAMKSPGGKNAIPILSVNSPKHMDELKLDETTVGSDISHRYFGKYRLIDFIAKGGMGEVWKAKDHFGNTVVIKTLLAGANASDEQLKRFRREADVMAKLYHHNICRIHEVGEVDRTTFIAMEYVDGLSLGEILNYTGNSSMSSFLSGSNNNSLSKLIDEIRDHREKEKKSKGPKRKHYRILPLQQSLSIIVKICDAVQFSHEKGILHRDLKPGNILIGPDGEPVVTDFGLAKMESDDVEVSMSMSGQVMGTLEYMAPEQSHSAKHVNEQADIYSLGAILYQLLTGQKHFMASGNILGDIMRLKDHESTPPRQHNKLIENDLEIIVLKALRTTPEHRYRSVEALKEDILRYQRGEVISAKATTTFEVFAKMIKRNKAVSGVVLASLILLIATFSFYVNRLQSEKREAESARSFAEEAMRKANQQKELAENALKKFQTEQKKRIQERHMSAPQFYNEALDHIRNKDLERALVSINTAIEYDNTKSEYLLPKAEILTGLKKPQGASQILKRFINKHPNDDYAKGLYAKLGGLSDGEYPTDKADEISQHFQEHQKFSLAEILSRASGKQFSVYQSKIESQWPGMGKKLTQTNNGKLRLDLRQARKAKSLEVLKGIPINQLVLDNTQVDKITEISKLPLEALSLKNTPITHLGGLQNLSLLSLNLSDMKLQPNDYDMIRSQDLQVLSMTNMQDIDLSAIKHMPLKRLDLTDSKVVSFHTLRGLPIQKLNINDSNVRTLDPLKNMPLKRLSLANTRVAKLDPIEKSRIKDLNIYNTQISDLRPIKELPLETLNLSGNNITHGIEHLMDRESLSKIGGAKLQNPQDYWSNLQRSGDIPLDRETHVHVTLKAKHPDYRGQAKVRANLGYLDVDLKNFPIDNPEILTNPRITRLGLSNSPFKDPAFLKKMPLEHLSLAKTKITEFDFLSQLPLSSLDLSETKIENLEALKGLELETLILANTEVESLEPIRDMKLKVLHIQYTQIKDLDPISNMPIVTLLFTPERVTKGIDTLIHLPTLKYLGTRKNERRQPKDDFWKKQKFGGKSSLKGEERIHAMLKTDNPDYSGAGKFKLKNDQIISADLGGMNIKNIDALKGHPIEKLYLNDNPVESIEFLKQCPIDTLAIENTQVEDLNPLVNVPLTHLSFTPHNIKKGFRVLFSRPLKSISTSREGRSQKTQSFWKDYGKFSPSSIQDINRVKAALKYKCPDYVGDGLFEFNNGKLVKIDLNGTKVDDLEALKGIPLEHLNISKLNIRTLTPLKGMPLKSLDITGSPIRSILSLRDMPLEKLWMNSTQVRNISYLSKSPLQELYLSNCRLVKDLSAIKNAPLKLLDLSYTGIKDLDDLKNNKLKGLDISGTDVKSLDPLAKSPIEVLILKDCFQIKDLNALKECKSLRKLTLPIELNDVNLDGIRDHPSLKYLGFRSDRMYRLGDFWRMVHNRSQEP